MGLEEQLPRLFLSPAPHINHLGGGAESLAASWSTFAMTGFSNVAISSSMSSSRARGSVSALQVDGLRHPLANLHS